LQAFEESADWACFRDLAMTCAYLRSSN